MSEMVDYKQEKFQIGNHIKFDVFGTDLRGTGKILGKGLGGICPMWIVLIEERPTDEMKNIEEKAILVQENFITKIEGR